MRRLVSFAVVFSALLFVASVAAAQQDILVPAGTLLRCTMSEPNFSSATAQVGDPVLCHLGSVSEFGRNVFPRGAYMSGHLEAEKDPGHFVGKGYLKIVFDRIGTPNADINVDTKIIGARGYPVDKDGDIKGKGHAKRDVAEWLFPPLWPWKVITLPARGPRPTLKGEQVLTLRLMEDVAIPRSLAAAVNSRDWRPPHAQIHELPSAYQSAAAYTPRQMTTTAAPALTNTGYVLSVDPAYQRTAQSQIVAPSPAAGPVQAVVASQAPVVATSTMALAHDPRTSSEGLTLIALRNESIWAVSEYWLAGDRLDYVLPSGAHESCALNDVDLMRTTQLNSERGITVSFHEVSHQPTL
jgi:hypothetical protein